MGVRDPAGSVRDEARLGLYVHVPFCARRCAYCDFSSGPLAVAAIERYLAGMAREVEVRGPASSDRVFTSVFFGGGTPSALPPGSFRKLWRLVRDHFLIAPRAEITVEANPESVRGPVLEAWAECGVNRLSIGAQSFDPRELRALGRVHAAERPADTFALARAHGFRRLSLDLMFGFPGSAPERWTATVERALSLDPEHLSAYCYIPEPGTPLGDAVERGQVRTPDDDEQADCYWALFERVERAGFRCYETSNFCRPGAEARHNLVYWLRRPYVGLGPSAHGFTGQVRYANHHSLERWADALESRRPVEALVEVESETSAAREMVMLGLRLADGIREVDYARPDWARVERRYGRAFEQAILARRLERTSFGVRVPRPFGFVADDVIAWVEAVAERASFDSLAAGFLPSTSCLNLHSPAI